MVPEITCPAPCAIYESSSLSQLAHQPPASQGFGLSFTVPHGLLYSASLRKSKTSFSRVEYLLILLFWVILSIGSSVLFFVESYFISFSSSSFLFGPINLQPLLYTKSIIFKCFKYTQYCS
uniref:Uncharacterized protein n=1 Tax=Micrurus spixii TaxID=129469 RepID=A0A2D4NI87_9SAUR